MTWQDFLRYRLMPKLRQLTHNHSENCKISYSQCGEDLILQQLFMVLGIYKVSYLDIGAHHPSYLSNTYLFYESGGHGVCVEPDPSLFAEFAKKRPRDINLNCGVGISSGEADFFVMSSSTLNTFSRAEAERYQSYGKQRVLQTIRVAMRPVNEILEQYFEKCPNLVSLDVEGMDYLILRNFDFGKFRPEVFCLETLSYTEDKSERKLTEIIDLMHENGYLTYADTYINTIFVDSAAWNKDR
ncbi:MAG TPA: FkbM family methyltransferase [Burkholderiales bacterium]